MKVRLAFHDWQKGGKSVYGTPEGIELSTGDFHSGTVFGGTLDLDEGNAGEIRRALAAGYEPVFYVFEEVE